LPDGADELDGECAQYGGDRAEEEQRPVVAAPAGRQERGCGDRDEGLGQGVADVEDTHVLGRLVGVGQYRGGERHVDGEVEALAEAEDDHGDDVHPEGLRGGEQRQAEGHDERGAEHVRLAAARTVGEPAAEQRAGHGRDDHGEGADTLPETASSL
jgi:hypothetical protein